jgi:hypothetical protein
MVNGVIMWSAGGSIPFLLSTVTFPVGTVVDIEAIGDDNTATTGELWKFSYWTGDIGGNQNSRTVTMNSDHIVGAVFYDSSNPSLYFTLDLGVINTAHGKIEWSVAGGVVADLTGPVTFPINTAVDIRAVGYDYTATTGEIWEFSYWTGDIGGNNSPRQLTMTSDYTIGAVFYDSSNTLLYFDLNILGTSVDNGKIMWAVMDPVTGAGIPAELTSTGARFPTGTQVDLEAVANAGFEFIEWMDGHQVDARAETMSVHLDVNALFMPIDGGSSVIIWLILLAALIAMMIIFLLASVRYRTIGMITCNGRGLEGVTVGYISNGKSGTAMTNEHGAYLIRGLAGAEVKITEVAKEGYVLPTALPEPFIAEKTTHMDFEMEEI